MRYIGLMSGTSADGVDAALVDLREPCLRLIATHFVDYPQGAKEAIESVIRDYPQVDDSKLQELDEALATHFAAAALALVGEAGVDVPVAAIGSHGQTIYHGPSDRPPITIQLGNPATIARIAGITTVGDFRSNDLRAGGQGAPLAPAFHNAVFRDPGADRLIINIGGIANLTHLPADAKRPVLGFDSGPGNTLMDQWCRLHTGSPFDTGGQWAAQGTADQRYIGALLDDPYFRAPFPKSTGREYFNLGWMKARLPGWAQAPATDIQATLLEVTARSIVQAIERLPVDEPREIYICGGGARNDALMSRLQALCAADVSSTEALGLAPEWVEACAFAWLAHRRIRELPGNLPSVTGASRKVTLGDIFKPPG